VILAVIRQVPSEYVLFLGWEPEGESLCYFFCPSATNQILSNKKYKFLYSALKKIFNAFSLSSNCMTLEKTGTLKSAF
jgi:hypothetical protein